MQTFLLQVGFSERQVYMFNSFIQIAQTLMMVAMTFFSGKIRKVKFVTGLSYLSLAVLASVFLLGACNPSIVGKPYTIAVFIAAGISYVGVGLYTILVYCLPYYVIDMKEYGKMTSLSGALAGGCAFVLSFVHAFIVAKFDYMQAMAWFFVLSIVCFALTSCVCLSMKEIESRGEIAKTTKADVLAAFKNKDTYILLLPNFARGIATGVMSVIAVIAISAGILDSKTSSYVNIVMQVASLLGSLLFAFSYKKAPPKNLLLIATLIVCAVFPFCICFGTVPFLALFFAVYIFRVIVDTAISVVVTEIIPKEQIGAYTSIRMLVFTGAQAVSTLIVSPIVRLVGYVGLLIFTSVMQLVCGLTYYFVAKIRRESGKKQSVSIGKNG